MLSRTWRKGNPSALLLGMQTGVALRKAVCSYLKNLKVELPFDPAIPLLGIYPKILKTPIQKNIHLHPYVHSSVIYNSQDLKTAQLPISG